MTSMHVSSKRSVTVSSRTASSINTRLSRRRASSTASSAPPRPAPTIVTGWLLSGCTLTPKVSCCVSQRFREVLGEPEDVLEAIVQRYGRDTHDVRVAPVAHGSALAEPVENKQAASGIAGDADRK